MAVPSHCTVLVIGGGPAGSYAAACLAREGVDTVVLEADKFPRYHIGESTLPSLRHFLKFIDADDAFDSHGFNKKIGAAFRLSQSKPDAFTSFIASGGPDNYAWNLIRSESDDLLFRHAGACGAYIADETKVSGIQFKASDDANKDDHQAPSQLSQPISATWTRKDGNSGTITFDYLVDASGRNGILSTKYLKNRQFNQNLKNVASWSYWKSDSIYGVGTSMETAPYFEALTDASGWAWFIPLHDGTRSVGIVQDQKLATDKKRQMDRPSTVEFYKKSLELAPNISKLLAGAQFDPKIKSASDWSYQADSYHLPNARICGDAGAFIDPLFSSGIHLAITGGLSAAVTIMASLRGGFDEQKASSWHSKKTAESYSRFFLAVSSANNQIRSPASPATVEGDGFQRAFDLLRPIIQGSVDTDTKSNTTQAEIHTILEFCFKTFNYVPPEQKEELLRKLDGLDLDVTDECLSEKVKQSLTAEELQTVKTLGADPFAIESFALGTIDGLAPRLERGKLGLVKMQQSRLDKSHFSSSLLDGKVPGIREGTVHPLMA